MATVPPTDQQLETAHFVLEQLGHALLDLGRDDLRAWFDLAGFLPRTAAEWRARLTPPPPEPTPEEASPLAPQGRYAELLGENGW